MAERSYTSEQLAVIEHAGGHAVVSAVAGSGKTETMIGRVRHLLQRHSHRDIVVVMFNKDARIAFQSRFEQRVGGPMPEIRTFHSMGNKIVNALVSTGALPPAAIETNEGVRSRLARDALSTIFRQVHGSDASPGKELVQGFLQFIGVVKGDVRPADEVLKAGRYGAEARGFVDAFDLFEDARRLRRLRFFDDLLYDPVMLMLHEPGAQESFTNRVSHIIVDEAQDMSGVQIALLRILAGTRASVMIVGDEDQAIYEWRGARPGYITREFESDFPGATRYALPHTFRFGHALSLAASYLISGNRNRHPKISISALSTPSTDVRLIELSKSQPGYGSYLQGEIDGGRSPSDIAVLVRTYNLSVMLELELVQLGVPYFIYGREPLQRIPELSAMIGVLQLASGQWRTTDSEDARLMFRSLLSMPSLYLTSRAMDELVERAMGEPENLAAIVRSAITEKMRAYQATQIEDRAELLNVIATGTEAGETPSALLSRYLSGTDFESAIQKQSASPENAEIILGNVRAFEELARQHAGAIADFLDVLDPLLGAAKKEPPPGPHVWIGSIHRAKGAQWPVVFVPGLRSGEFPPMGVPASEEEEQRRLCYVAMTRAVETLCLVHPADPELSAYAAEVGASAPLRIDNPASPFVWEMELATSRYAAAALQGEQAFEPVAVARPDIANSYFQRFAQSASWKLEQRQRPVAPDPKVRHASGPAGGIAPGTRVEHEAFGPGVLLAWIDDRVCQIRFDTGEKKMFVAKNTPMREI